MTRTRTYTSQGTTFASTEIDAGQFDYGFVDQKGRACGYRWVICQIVPDQPAKYYNGRAVVEVAAWQPYFELISSPARNGQTYGPAFNRALTGSLEEARQIAVKRAEASRKRDAKKFVKAVA